ncbi:MAG: ABC transporter ATP-binding protein [Gammaproteobacteria bacterium]|nr:ABC transporter ATP-binding protein [Gammaproteobacteria bacterium]
MNRQVPSNSPAITLQGLSKRFKDVTALENVDLEIARGKILGFLGPNGAGKTTTIRILTGFLKPDTGVVQLLGHDMRDPAAALAARRQLGFVPEIAGLDTSATGQWLLDHLARLQGQAPVDRDLLADALALKDRDLRRPIGRLSRGTRQKINLIQGLQHRPAVLVLDEPGEGLDPLAKRALFDVLGQARERGATVFFSSHVLGEVESLCDDVALIRDGRLGRVDELDHLQRTMQRRVTLELAADTDAEAQLRALPTVSQLRLHEHRWQFHIAELDPLLKLLAELPVHDVVIEPPSLEDLFMQYYDEAATTSE